MDTYFHVPSRQELLDVLGFAPTPGLETGVVELAMPSGDGYDVVMTLDVPAGSTTVRVRRESSLLFDLYREGSVRMLLAQTSPEIVVEFEAGETAGRLAVSLWPVFGLSETTLRV